MLSFRHSNSPVRSRDERGVYLVMFGLMLTILMIMSAVAVDLANQYNERRQDQTAADAGVMAGAQETTSQQAIGDKIRSYIRSNLTTSYTDSAWDQLWTACADGQALASKPYKVGGVTAPCISFDTSGGLIRVRVPQQIFSAAFAGIAGVHFLSSHASAEAIITSPTGGLGAVLPFAVPGAASSGVSLCLRSSSGGTAPTGCTGGSNGNYGAIQSPQYGNSQLGTSQACNGDKNSELAINVAVGIDHILNAYTATQGVVTDVCTNFRPNNLYLENGVGSGLLSGFLSNRTFGSNNTKSRLQQYPSGYPTRTVEDNGTSTYLVDNKPLWEFIPASGIPTGSVPSSCDRSNFPANGTYTSSAGTSQMIRCLTDYVTGSYSGCASNAAITTCLFGIDANSDGIPDIVQSPRFSTVPQFASSSSGLPNPCNDLSTVNSTSTCSIQMFRRTFLEEFFFNCSANGCGATFSPGEATSNVCDPNGNSCKGLTVDDVTALLLPESSLPGSVRGGGNGPGGGTGPYVARLFS